MRKFLLKFSIFLLIVLAVMAGMEYYVRCVDNSPLRHRSDYFFEHAGELDGIIYGPSLTARAINPEWLSPSTANLAMAGGAINVDYKVFLKSLEHAEPKFVIFDLTLAYLERRNDATYENLRRLPYYYGIWNEKAQLKDLFLARAPFADHFLNRPREADYNKYGFEASIPDECDNIAKIKRQIENKHFQLIAKKRAGRRLALNDANYHENVAMLEELVTTCRERNITLIFYEPPKYCEAVNVAPPVHYYRRSAFLDRVVDNKTVHWWDLSDFQNEELDHFLNLIHVNIRGAELVTEEIDRRLEEMGY
ncbi:hypothetical protein CEQ90_08990 [Lewinellaceae bacterium SD302]|nr:hypothetical protein CEQ90_08990 [Lewinellaceae bacterium SD302]